MNQKQSAVAAMVDMKLEVVIIPVSDVDRAKVFYVGLGWRLDADFPISHDVRVLQLTPPGSSCSIIFGTGITGCTPGSAQGLLLVVQDIDGARTALIERGVDVSEVFHFREAMHATDPSRRLPGRDPEDRSYSTFLSFKDPDGNGWLVQEIQTRLPGRV